MKVRVTLMTENDIPASSLGNDPEGTARKAWEIFLKTVCAFSEHNDYAYVEKVEFIDEGGTDEP